MTEQTEGPQPLIEEQRPLHHPATVDRLDAFERAVARKIAARARAQGRSPAEAMARLLFHEGWSVPADRGEAFSERYFWLLQDNIVDNLERTAALLGAKIVWDEEAGP